MATSGSCSRSVQFGSYTLTVTRTSVDIANNCSYWKATVSYKLNAYGNINSSASKNITVMINNVVYNSSYTFGSVDNSNNPNSITKTIWTKDNIKIQHEADGTKTFEIYLVCQARITYQDVYVGDISTTGTIVADTIGRTTTPTLSATSVNLNSSLTIYTPRASDSFTHKLYSSVGNSGKQLFASGVATSFTWKVPLSLAHHITSSTSATVVIYCETYNGSTLIGTKTVTFIAVIPNSVVPSISSISCSEATSDLSSLGVYIQNKSTLKFTISASGSYSSTIKSCRTTIDGINYSGLSFTSYPLKNKGTIVIVTTVTDSRGRTASKSTTITVYEYFSPKITYFTVERCLSDGALNDEGTYVKCTHSYEVAPLNNKNTKVWKFQYHNGSDWVDLKTATTQIYSSNKSTYIETTKTFSADSSYKFRLYVADYFSDTSWERELSTSFVLMNYNASGKGIAIGKKSEKNAFEVGLPSEFNESVVMDKNLDITGFMSGKIGVATFTSLADSLATSNNNFVLPILTTTASNDLPSATNEWQYCIGLLLSRASGNKQKWIVLFGNGSGRIAINHIANDTWSGWKYLSPS